MLRALALALPLLLALPALAGDPSAFLRVPPSPRVEADLAGALAGLRPEAAGAHVAWLADPARQGRGLGSRGLAATADHVERILRGAGLHPLPGHPWRQAVPLRWVSGEGSVRLEAGRVAFVERAGRTCVLPALAPGTLEGPVVFAGYGLREAALGRDDFRGLPVKGRVVVLVGDLPPEPAWRTPELVTRYADPRGEDRYDARLEILASLGARAVVALEPGLARGLAGRRMEPRWLAPADAPGRDLPPLVRVDLEAMRPWMEALHLDPARPMDLPGVHGRIAAVGRAHTVDHPNVIAWLPGTDPALRDRAVVLGAHLDHLGRPGGVLHPGADDNASGVAALLEIAKAFARHPRPRPLVFAFWTGEEEGRFGSAHYVRHPWWPLVRTDAYLNLDMIGHPATKAELEALAKEGAPAGFLEGLAPEGFAEPGLPPGRPALAEALRQAGAASGLALHLDFTDGLHGGSDYRDFARRGVPFVRFFGSYFPGYHRPEDTADRLDSAQVNRMARLAFATAWALASAP